MAACGVPSLLVVLLIMPFPESPRYLLYANRPEQALTVLQRIFVVNTRLHEKDFPVSIGEATVILILTKIGEVLTLGFIAFSLDYKRSSLSFSIFINRKPTFRIKK